MRRSGGGGLASPSGRVEGEEPEACDKVNKQVGSCIRIM